MKEILVPLVAILLLSWAGEGIVEYLVKARLDWVLKKFKPDLGDDDVAALADVIGKYSAAAAGVALSFLYTVDIMTLVGLDAIWTPGGYIVTGLMMGRGSNWMHDTAKKFLGAN